MASLSPLSEKCAFNELRRLTDYIGLILELERNGKIELGNSDEEANLFKLACLQKRNDLHTFSNLILWLFHFSIRGDSFKAPLYLAKVATF